MPFQSLSKSHLIKASIVSFVILFFVTAYSHFTANGIVVFCDVGQGDATYIRTLKGVDILVDAGSGKKVLECLGKYMPWYDRTVEYAFLSHPQKDHYGGFLDISSRYTIKNFVIVPIFIYEREYKTLLQKLKEKKTVLHYGIKGKKIFFGGNSNMYFVWPDEKFIHFNSKKEKSEKNFFSDYMIYKPYKSDLNSFSQVSIFQDGSIKILFTGDADPLSFIILEDQASKHLYNIDILKVPHHGSKNGITKRFLSLLKPSLSVVSVGARNRFGHPSKEVIKMFQDMNLKLLLTSRKGSILIRYTSDNWGYNE